MTRLRWQAIAKGLSVYAAAVLLLPALAKPYATLISATAQKVSVISRPAGPVTYRAMSQPQGWMDVEATLTGPSTQRTAVVRFESPVVGYFPMAFFLGLVIAMPMRRRDRLKVLTVGTTMMHAYVALRLLVPVMGAGSHTALQLYELNGIERFALDVVDDLLVAHSESGYVVATLAAFVPFFMWARPAAARSGETSTRRSQAASLQSRRKRTVGQKRSRNKPPRRRSTGVAGKL